MALDQIALRTLRPGTRLGRYTVVQRIGCGGMAELYLARADGIGGFHKALALKVVHAHLLQDPTALRAFLREARLAAGLDHPNVVQVVDVGVMEGEHVLVMEYVHGQDLSKILRAQPSHQTLPLAIALRIVLDACAGLQYAHEKRDPQGVPLGIVHRDVSPSNVLVGFNGVVKLADFGIAKVGLDPSTTLTGTIKGKFGYMSPEQSLGEEVDARSDVFSIGVVLYEASTAHRAFPGANAFAITNAVVAGQYRTPQDVCPTYPDALANIVTRALATERDDRYSSIAALRAELEAFAASACPVASSSEVGAYVAALFPDDTQLPDISAVRTNEPDGTLRTRETVVTDRPLRRPTPVMGVAAALGVAGAIALGLGWSGAVTSEPVVSPQTAIPTPQADRRGFAASDETEVTAAPTAAAVTREEGTVAADAPKSRRKPSTNKRRRKRSAARRASKRRASLAKAKRNNPPAAVTSKNAVSEPRPTSRDSIFPASMQ